MKTRQPEDREGEVEDRKACEGKKKGKRRCMDYSRERFSGGQ